MYLNTSRNVKQYLYYFSFYLRFISNFGSYFSILECKCT